VYEVLVFTVFFALALILNFIQLAQYFMNMLVKLAEYVCLVCKLSSINASCNNQLPFVIIPIFSTKSVVSLNVYSKKILSGCNFCFFVLEGRL
jgi:hypothetical protein